MDDNVGSWDRAIRVILGLVLIVAPFLPQLGVSFGSWTIALSVIVGAVLLVTGAFGFCPLYAVLGLRTRRH